MALGLTNLYIWTLLAAICIPAAATQAVAKACYAYFGWVSDLGFTYSQNLARAWVDAELLIESRYVEGVGLSSRDFQVDTFNDFLQDGCDIIVIGANSMESLLLEYADANPSIRFICLTCCCFDDRPNVAPIEINSHESAYISGVVAAMQDGVNTLAYVGSNYVPGSLRNLNAFALGARSVRPNISMLVSHVGSWFNPRTERIISKQLILQHGVDLLAYDSDSTAVVEVAKELGKLSIAAKVDGTAVHGESNLMSRIRQWNVPLLETMSAAVGVKNWTLHKDDNAVVGFAEEAVTLGTFSSRVSLDARIRAEQLKEMFRTQPDRTWCLQDGQGGFPAFCPLDADIESAELGGVTPSSIYPCSLQDGYAVPEAGNCLAWSQQRNMAWILEGYKDLGLAVFLAECVKGTRMDFTGSDLCVPCAAGSISLVSDAEECEPCVPGRFAVDGLECRQCPSGTYSDSLGNSACADCPAGNYAPVDGQTQCGQCQEGYFTSGSGQSQCLRCRVGTFANQSGSSRCTACAEGETTLYNAAFSARECICPEGSFRDHSGSCALCPMGMICSRGSDVANLPGIRAPDEVCETTSCEHPQTLPGYMSLPDEPLRVYKCLTESACPGGTAGVVSSCGAFRAKDEVACGVCASGSFENSDDNCEECKGGEGVLMSLIILFLALVAVVATSYAVNKDLLMQGHGMLNVIIVSGVLLAAIQTTIVFSQLELDWVHPLEGVVVFATRFFSFNVRMLRASCHLPVSPVSRFAANQLVAPCCVPILALAVFVKKYVFKNCSVSVVADLVNSVGTIFSMFFIAVSLASIQPSVCYPHPMKSEGSSMLSEPAVLCWADDERHSALVAIAIISFLLVPANFFSACLFATWMRARIMVVNDDAQRWWLHAFRFIFFRFKPGKHSYGVVLLLRNLTICLIPALVPGRLRGVQLVLLLLVLLLSAIYQATVYPFSTRLSNMVDSCTSVVLILILVLGMLNTDIQVHESDMLVLGTLVLCMGLLAIAGGACLGLRAAFFPSVRFHYFLSHHKADAAAQARFLQMLFRMHLRRSCFLDSDNLVDLEVLFDVVKSSVAHFVMLLTRDTLRRPWCVGELVIALEAKLPAARILHPSFQEPSQSDLNDIAVYIPQQGSLLDFHIDAQRIIPALESMSGQGGKGVSTIVMEEKSVAFIGTFVFHNIIRELSNAVNKKINVSRFEQDSLVISTDAEDYEAAAAGGILMSGLQEKSSSRLVAGIIFLADVDACSGTMSIGRKFSAGAGNSSSRATSTTEAAEESSMDAQASIRRNVGLARAVIVLLSSSSLQSLQQIEVIDTAGEYGRCTIPVYTPQFQFPTELYFTKHLPALVGQEAGLSAVASMKHFFAQIAVTFTTHASYLVLEAEVEQVVARVPLRKSDLFGQRDSSHSSVSIDKEGPQEATLDRGGGSRSPAPLVEEQLRPEDINDWVAYPV